MDRHSILEAAKHLDIKQNVSIQVIDQKTGQVVQEHTGHNSATNSLLFGIAHHLIGDFLPNEGHGLNPGYSMLSNYVPRYISLGTMGLLNQKQDMYGLPAGIGDFVPDSSDPYYRELQQAVEDAKQSLDDAEEALAEECPHWPATEACENCQVCSDRIAAKKQAVEDAKVAYELANDAFVAYSEEARFVEYMQHTPGFGADGYSEQKNNGRKYFGLGKAFTSYDVLGSYKASSRDQVTYKGILYECKADTAVPAGPFDTNCWDPLDESEQPSVVEFDEKGVPHLKTTINLELISPSYPRTLISYRDVVPEKDSEQPKILDVVYSALISTGALKQFRPDGQDYIFITEAGLWSKKTWSDGNENGLLAGYRIGPPNSKNWDMTDPKNRKILKENILKVGKNQVVQVVWKIQIGSIDEFLQEAGGEYVPPYSDTLYYTIGSIYSNNLNRLLVEKVVSTDRNATVSFIKSDTKRGCPVPNDIFRTNLNADGPLYLDFVFNENGEEIIYWWTETGEVNYYDNYVSHMFDNMNVVAYELEGWRYISPSVYITNTGIDELANLVDMYSCNRFTPLFTENQLPPGTELPTNRNRSNNSTSLYYYDEHGELQLYYDDLYYFIHTASEPVTTSNEDYKVYVGRSEGYYYCGATLEFYDDWNFRDINNALCFTTPEPDSDTDSDTEGPESRSLTHLSYRGWDTARLTSLSHAFDGCNNIENIDLTGWNTSNITDMSFAFSNTDHLEFLIGIDAWDVSNVFDMDHMFYGCGTYDVVHCGVNDPSQYEDYTILTLDAWDTGNVTNMNYMFARSYISIPYKSFNTSNVTSMAGTFNYSHYVDYDTDAHEDIIGAKLLWDTSNVTDMSYMFYESYDCKWDLSRLNTSSVTNAEGMFYFARTVNYSTIALLDVHNVTNFGSMFENADGNVYDSPYLEPHAFEWIDVSHWRTSSATNMSRMFYGVSTYIKGVENFNTSNVTDFSSMFEYAYIEEPNSAPNVDEYGLVHIDLSNWDVHSGEDFSGMFERTSKTTHYRPRYYYTFEGFDEWDVTSNAVSVRDIFSDTIFPFNSSNPMTLDFSGWDMSGVGNYQGMFRRLLGTEGTIEPPTDVRCTVILPSTLKPLSMFYSTNETFKEANIQKLVWNGVSVYSNSELNNVKQTFRNSRLVEIVATNWDLSGVTNVSDLFYMQYLRKINISGWNVSNVTDFSRMLCKWETSQWYTNQYSTPGIMDYSSMNNWVVNPDSTFTNMCSGNLCADEAIAQLDGYHAFEQPYVFPNWTGTWDTTNLQSTVVTATNFPYYYQQAGESYTAYYLGTKMTTGGTVDPTSMDARFVNTPSKYTDFGTFTPTQPVVEPVTLSSTGISQLRNATTSDNRFISLETGYQTDMLVYADPNVQYYDPETPTSLDMTAEEFKEHANYLLDTTDPNIKVYYDGEYYWCDAPLQFSDNTNFAQIVDAVDDVMAYDVSFRGWDASNITSLSGVFDHRTFNSLALDMDSVNMLTNLSESFTEFSAKCLWGLDSWDTSHVTTMRKAFSDRYIDTGYYFGGDISSWDTSNVTNMGGLFEGVSSYIPYDGYDFFDISNLDTSNVTNMSRMFYNSYGLRTDLSRLNTSKVTDMSYMFYNARGFHSGLDLGSWDVSNVTDMSYMFAGGQSYDDLTGLGEWNTESVETFEGIFAYGYSGTVTEHYPPSGILNWDISNARTFDHMFDSCTLSDFDCDDFISWFSPTGYFTCSYAFAGATLPSKYSQTYGGYLFDINNWPSRGSCQDASYMFAYSKISESDLSILSIGSGIALSHNTTNIFKGTDIDVLVMDGISVDSYISGTWKDIFKYTGESIEDDSPKFSKLIATYWNIIGVYDFEADISNLFSEMHYLTKVDLSNWDVISVTNFSEMFYKPDSTLPGVLDFTSLDSWSNIDLTADFTRMCASNLDDKGSNEYHAFEQGYRFPNWTGGTWDTTGLQVVHIDQTNYPYYYNLAGEEYDAYCFGTQVVDDVVWLINKPPANSTFGTFIPTPSTNWTYDWDLTQSLTDTAQNQPLVFLEDGHSGVETTIPPVGQYTSGTGIIFDSDGTDYFIKLPANLLQAGTVLEMDFTHFETGWADFGGNFIVSTNEYFNEIGFSFDREGMEWLFMSSHVSGDGYDSMGVTSDHEFENSTMRLECIESSNSYTQWKIYKDDTLVYTSPETSSGSPFLPQQSSISGYEWGFSPYLLTDVIVTGIRILIPN